jgi:hypothetical protein
MIIIYHCYGGTHSSVLAAAIHLNILPDNRLPTYKEIVNLPHYDRRNSSEIGVPVFYGEDEYGNKVYIQGMGKAAKIVKNLINSFLTIEEISKKQIKLVNTLGNVNILTRIGGFLSRGLGLVIPGRMLTVWGLKLNYYKFLKTVKRVKGEISIA